MHLQILAGALLLWPGLAPAETKAYVAIIIDDIGYNHARGKRAINLPAALTYSIIPETDHATRLANYAHSRGKEVMVHLPMENIRNHPMGPMALTSELSEPEVTAIMERAIAQVPHATGLNNHMGSSLTQRPQAMAWLMRAIRKHDLFFIDSRTTSFSMAREMALLEQVATANRDVFLDNDHSEEALDIQFAKLMHLAKSRRTAIAIGHPHDATLDFLAKNIARLEVEQIQLVSVSDLLDQRQNHIQLARY